MDPQPSDNKQPIENQNNDRENLSREKESRNQHDQQSSNNAISKQVAKQSQLKLQLKQKKLKLKKQESQKKQQIVQIKKPKITIQFYQFIPDFLLQLSVLKPKAVIRIGKNYQVNVPKSCNFSYKYCPLNQLKVWGAGDFNQGVFKKFRQKFGQNRTEQDLILLLYQFQCGWDNILEYLTCYKTQIRKNFLQRDRSRPS